MPSDSEWNSLANISRSSDENIMEEDEKDLVKVHLTPKIFFAKIIRLISWSNVAQKIFELVKFSDFYAPSKYFKMRPFWFATELNGTWVEGRM